MNWNPSSSWLVSTVTACMLVSAVAYGAPADGAAEIDPKAVELVQRMADHLSGVDSFRVVSETTVEVVLESGQKLQFGSSTRATVQRPDRLRSDRQGELAAASFYYDGSQLTLYAPRKKYYASADAPASLDDLLPFLEDRLDMSAPAADFLYSDGGAGLLDGVQSGLYVGLAEVSGVRCHHLAFRAEEVDWQIWIEDGARPLPRKYVITTRDVEGSPQFEVELREWEIPAKIIEGEFTFSPPEGSTKIEFDQGAEAPEQEEGS